MKKILLLLFLSLCLTACDDKKEDPKPTRPNLPNEVTFGLDLLAAQHPSFQLGLFLELIGDNEKFPIGVLDKTFGEDMYPIELILKSGKTDHFRVHFINGPCIRNRNCQSYDYGFGHDIETFNEAVKRKDPTILKTFSERVADYCSLVAMYSDSIRFYFSWSLEHDLDAKAWNILDEEGRKACFRSDYYVVNNPVGSNSSFPKHPRSGVLFESHNLKGLRPESNITSLDGEPARDINAIQWADKNFHIRSKLAFTWDWKHNCRPDSGFIPPRERKDCPNAAEHLRYINFTRAAQKHIDQKGQLPQPIPTPPDTPLVTIFENFDDGREGNLWKPVAEHDKNLVVLTANKHSEMECSVQRKNGEWEKLNCKKGEWNRFDCCTHNGNRCAYRGSRKCSEYKEPKIECKGKEYNLVVRASGGVCDRHD